MQWWSKQWREGMNPRTYLLVGVLAVVLVWIYSLDEKTRTLRAHGRGGSAPAPSVAVLPASASRVVAATPTPPGWGEDPFQRRFRIGGEPATATPRAAGVAPRGAGLYLQGVMNGPRGRTALVNGEVVREGDRFGGREVLQIGARSVLILDQGTVVTLSLKGDGS
jgi:hypothetical protein